MRRGNGGLTGALACGILLLTMRESFFRDLPPLTMEEAAKPMSLEERTYLLNGRMKQIAQARTRIDGRIIAAVRTERTKVSRTGT